MKIDEILNILRKKIGKHINQSLLAKSLDVTRQSVSNRIKNNSELTISELEKIEKFFKVKIMQTCNDNIYNLVKTDFYPETFVNCKNGNIEFSNEKIIVNLPTTLIFDYSDTKKYSMISAAGDSMSPSINNGDRLIIEHWNNNNRIIDNKVYAFCYKSEFYVKRLAKNVNEIIIKSDNPIYGMHIVKGDDINNLNILGLVIGITRNI